MYIFQYGVVLKIQKTVDSRIINNEKLIPNSYLDFSYGSLSFSNFLIIIVIREMRSIDAGVPINTHIGLFHCKLTGMKRITPTSEAARSRRLILVPASGTEFSGNVTNF